MHRAEEQLLRDKYFGVRSEDFSKDCERLALGEPLAYVIGWQPFLGLTIYLDSHPLIPRPETEWWTELLLQKIGAAGVFGRDESRSATAREEAIFQQKNMPLVSSESPAPIAFLDLCSGSGAIGCAALKYLPNAKVYFGEIDPAHDSTIKKNIAENHLDASRTHIEIGDLFEPFVEMRFDIIACNPPYIPTSRPLDRSVVDYEPRQALFADSDGLGVIRRLSTALAEHLTQRGQAWIECDSEHAEAAASLFVDQGFSCQIRTDQYQTPRILVVSLR